MTKPDTNSSWRERQKLDLRELIYETALQLFRTQGFDKTTVQQIASAGGIGKGTFFNHFFSKDQVLQEWYRRITQTALDEVFNTAFASGRQAILALMNHLTVAVSADPLLWDAKAAATTSELLKKEEKDLDKEVLAFCKQAIERDLAKYQPVTRVDTNFLAEMILTVLTGSGHSWSVAGHRQDLSKILEQRVSFILDAALIMKETKS
jgi:AcrR family transcriptional regulator